MSPFTQAMSLMVVVAAGCATQSPSDQTPETLAAVAAQPDVAEARSVGGAAETTEPKIVELRASDPDPKVAEVVCREELLHASNVIKKRCMSAVDWARYQRMQELQAQDFLRRLRGEL